MNLDESIERFWQAFLEETGRPQDLSYKDCYHFDVTEESANELLRLVLDGKKRATSSSAYAYGPGEPQPRVGDLSIVTGWDGLPRCVVETTAITILPFGELTFDIVKREGEDDTLESWQEGHIRFFQADGKASGYEFSWEMPVIFEDFQVVYVGEEGGEA